MEDISTDSNANALPIAVDLQGVAFYNMLNGNGIIFSLGGDAEDVIQYTIIAKPTGPTAAPTMKPSLYPTTTDAPTLDITEYEFREFDNFTWSLPQPLSNHFSYIYDGKLNIFGGVYGKYTDDVWLNKRYELDLDGINFENYFVNNVSGEINETKLAEIKINKNGKRLIFHFQHKHIILYQLQ